MVAQCECGTVKEVYGPSIKAGASTSCGCLLGHYKRMRSALFSKSSDPMKAKVYNCWVGMKQRCLNTKATNYHKYGGRGIKVCERWRNSFEAFFEDMGYPGNLSMSIDRINGEGGYCKENCRWATLAEQTENRRSNLMIVVDGERKPLMEWVASSPVSLEVAYNRLRRGWDPKDAIFLPRKTTWSRHRKIQA